MEKKQLSVVLIVLAVAVVFDVVGCSSTPPTPSLYDVSATADRTVNVSYRVTDQQAYAIAKAWFNLDMSKYAYSRIVTDDSTGGVLATTGGYVYNDNYDNITWSSRIIIADGIARIDLTTKSIGRYDSRYVSRADGQDSVKQFANYYADETIKSFREAFN